MYSIIIPANNECLNLWYTLHSIRLIWDEWPEEEQGEVIVVDNGSTDGTRKFLEDQGMTSWVRRIDSHASGPGPVRHDGARVARGEILIFADAHVLFSADFFRRICRAMREEVWDDVGSLHVPIAWNGTASGPCATHYELTLEKNFWGVNTPGRFTEITEIAAAGHACLAVRRDRYFEVGGYAAPFAEYGGDETYLDLKFARFGYRNYSLPGVCCYHCSQRRQLYRWTNDVLIRNNMISALTIGGPTWGDRVMASTLQEPGVYPKTVEGIYHQAVEMAAEDQAWIARHASRTLEEVLEDFAARGVPR